ncbi:hypothetical protein OQH61_07125 [Helicobacter sp. MIT 21-1697]|uniref:hypothetical protein n=1 Tax=Helicobacter sp. MIT 21-1697 TaxID=2993733 RepID=UPI00224B4A4A|nr:hypothetical protein [Helicobacter sp. MIT 21-1697]MCX2717501.1 hypothetical protein [Helicobacter sp. MIT 21-1697]
MSKHKVVLTAQDRKELAPLLHITKAERELMPQEILDKLEILAKEQDKNEFQDLEQIIEESLHIVESLAPNAKTTYKKQRHIKDYLWWQTNYRIFLAQRKAQRARRKCYKNKSN